MFEPILEMGSRRFWDLLGIFEGVLSGWVESGFGIFQGSLKGFFRDT